MIVNKYKIDCAYTVAKMPNHEEIKNDLKNMILQYENSKTIIVPQAEVNVSYADWQPNSPNNNKQWADFFIEKCRIYISAMYEALGYKYMSIDNIWFQGYSTGSGHGWHVHPGTNFGVVYYLSLPKNSEPTQIINPYNQKDIINIDAQEGDVLVFPGFAIHRAPVNKDNDDRIVIAFNCSIGYPDEFYGEGIIDE